MLKGNLRVDDTPIHKLLRETITNSCVHADFYGRQGLVIQKSEQGYRLSNPGTVRISISDAIEGGISDPRNGIMLKIFSLIEFSERAGCGLSGICKRWEKVYHTPVTIEETHKDGVDRTVLFILYHSQPLHHHTVAWIGSAVTQCLVQRHPHAAGIGKLKSLGTLLDHDIPSSIKIGVGQHIDRCLANGLVKRRVLIPQVALKHKRYFQIRMQSRYYLKNEVKHIPAPVARLG